MALCLKPFRVDSWAREYCEPAPAIVLPTTCFPQPHRAPTDASDLREAWEVGWLPRLVWLPPHAGILLRELDAALQAGIPLLALRRPIVEDDTAATYVVNPRNACVLLGLAPNDPRTPRDADVEMTIALVDLWHVSRRVGSRVATSYTLLSVGGGILFDGNAYDNQAACDSTFLNDHVIPIALAWASSHLVPAVTDAHDIAVGLQLESRQHDPTMHV